LRKVDPTFAPAPHPIDSRRATSFATKGFGLRVDFLTPNTGAETEEPQQLAALGVDAHPFRFLDFLIHEPIPAVVLHGAGVYVLVPTPERFAFHKLIVAGRRDKGSAKSGKDLLQAQELLRVLAARRPGDLSDAWREACGRGDKWNEAICGALGQIDANVRDMTLKAVGLLRNAIPELKLTFSDTAFAYDRLGHDVVFTGEAGGADVACTIPRSVQDDDFGCVGLDAIERVKIMEQNRQLFQHIAANKYLAQPIDKPGQVRITRADIAAWRARDIK
jgi:hypothetical protein